MGGETAARTRLPAEAVRSLREAFAAELHERLPALRALRDGTGDDGPDLDAARRAAHSLASSAAVLGEPDAARAARDLEARLVAEAPLVELHAPAGAVVALLEGWTA